MSEDHLPPLREIIARHDLKARKGLGQNFLLDLNLTRRIARSAAPLADFTIVEVGPGPGGLTRALLIVGARRIIAIEKDRRVLPALAEIAAAYPGRLEVIAADALAFDWSTLAGEPSKVVANLPYNVATPLLTGWLTGSWPPWYASLTLMFQKEVAERISARHGSKAFGRLAVLAQWRCGVRKLFDVDRRAFTPPPNVTSALVQLVPRQRPEPQCSVDALERTTAAAFGQRRKMLRSSLRQILPDPVKVLNSLGIDPDNRAEQLAVADFCRIARAVEDRESP
jgi:16S rRNA (adenine1518-N6/adenine1519-N6)-dimethyltransferase